MEMEKVRAGLRLYLPFSPPYKGGGVWRWILPKTCRNDRRGRIIGPWVCLRLLSFGVQLRWRYLSLGRRRGGNLSCFSDPLRRASRRAVSLEMSASRPSRTKEVFSCTPVNLAAFCNRWSSMFNVVRIRTNMYYFYIIHQLPFLIFLIHT